MVKQNKKHCRKIQQSAILHLLIIMPKKNFMILNEPNKGKYTIEVPSRKEYHFLEYLRKRCFLKVIKRRVTKEPLNSEFLDEIHLIIVVCK